MNKVIMEYLSQVEFSIFVRTLFCSTYSCVSAPRCGSLSWNHNQHKWQLRFMWKNGNRPCSRTKNSSFAYHDWSLRQVHYVFLKHTRQHYVKSFSRRWSQKAHRWCLTDALDWAKFIQFYFMKWVWQDWFCHILKFPSLWQQKGFLSLLGGKLVGWCSSIDYSAIQIISMSQEITLQCLDVDSLVI